MRTGGLNRGPDARLANVRRHAISRANAVHMAAARHSHAACEQCGVEINAGAGPRCPGCAGVLVIEPRDDEATS